jgi:Na+-driven multidrug efflux pump
MKKFIGDKAFYRTVLTIAIPVMIQNGVTNLVNFLDNIMVGQIGTEQMSGVAIVNQLIFVFNLCIFGIVSGASIFGTQYYGKRDFVGMRNAFRFKLVAGIIASLLSILLLFTMQIPLISLFLHNDGTSSNLALALHVGRSNSLLYLASLCKYLTGNGKNDCPDVCK